MYTLLWIPKTGLHYSGGDFFDGRQQLIAWSRTIHVYPTHSQAETAKKKVLERHPDAHGELVVLPVKIQEHE